MRSDVSLCLFAAMLATPLLGCAGTTGASQRSTDTIQATPTVAHATPPGGDASTPTVPPTVPVEFAVVAEGRCKALDVSFVGDDTYVHAHGWIGRVGEGGTLAERLDTSRPGVREAR